MSLDRETVFEHGLIDENVLAEIPETCECGGEIMFTDTVRQIFCSNPHCTYKVAARLEKMAKMMQADGWGESACQQICRQYKMISPFQVFLLENRADIVNTGVAGINKKVENICDRGKRSIYLWELVKYAGIPNIEQTAYKIFTGYPTIEDAYKDIEAGQVIFVAEKLGIKNKESAVMALEIYNNLMAYKDELVFGESQFDIKKESGSKLKIAITGGVFGFNNKSDFIKFINKRYNGELNAMLASSVSSSVDILVADGDTSSNKFNSALKINQKYIDKGISDGTINPADIGKFKNERDLHPIGEAIMIGEHDKVIERLDRVFGYSKGE